VEVPQFNQGATVEVPLALALAPSLALTAHYSDKPMYDEFFNKIEKGMFSTGSKRLSKETKIPHSTIERILKTLESDNMITRKVGGRCSVFSIVNWDTYQGHQEKVETSNLESGNLVETSWKQNKKDKNDKNTNTESGSDEEKVKKELPPPHPERTTTSPP